MKLIHAFFLFILPYFARLYPSNWTRPNQNYVQLWYCMPRRWVRKKNGELHRAKLRIIIEHVCGFLTGHEISDTERGYGGGSYIDCNCRWCDKTIRIPVSETAVSPIMADLMPQIRKDSENG